MNLTSTTGEKSIKEIKVGDQINLTVRSNGRRFAKVFKIKILEQIEIERCFYCSVILNSETKTEHDGNQCCQDCKDRRI